MGNYNLIIAGVIGWFYYYTISNSHIRFYNDREVRAVWDEEKSKWWFSVLDIVGVLNDQDDYQKNRNYWKYLKTKLKGENSNVVSGTNQLKLLAPELECRAGN